MAHDVFVSYATPDKTTADAAVATLEQHQVRCWIAPRDVPPGKEYADVIVGAINEARLMVLVFSAHSNSSRHVMREVERAVNKGIPIVPFRIEDVTPSGSFEYFISGTHWLDALTTPLQQHLDRLTATVQRLLGEEPTVEAGVAGAVPPSGGLFGSGGRIGNVPRPMLLAGGGALAAVAAIGLFLGLSGGGSGEDSTPTPTSSQLVEASPTPDDNGTPDATDDVSVTGTPPVIVASGDIEAVAVGYDHVCALTETGLVQCWGSNRYGQLGDGSTDTSAVPVYVCAAGAGPPCTPSAGNVLTEVVSVHAGYQHSCAVTEGMDLKCWGLNNYGQMGDGTMNNHTTPVDVDTLTGEVVRGDTGNGYTCAVEEAGSAKCWGLNNYNQLGDGTRTDHLAPNDVPGISAVREVVTSGTGSHTCAVTGANDLWCWGRNNTGQLGDGRACGNSFCTPQRITALAGAVDQLVLGQSHTCVITTSGAVKCWGNNGRGQVGVGSRDPVWEPASDAQGLSSGTRAVAAGDNHTCAVTEARQVRCWGQNSNDQIGDGTKEDSDSPVLVCAPGAAAPCTDADGNVLESIESISAERNQTCAVSTEGAVYCWGNGQLTPLEIVGLD